MADAALLQWIEKNQKQVTQELAAERRSDLFNKVASWTTAAVLTVATGFAIGSGAGDAHPIITGLGVGFAGAGAFGGLIAASMRAVDVGDDFHHEAVPMGATAMGALGATIGGLVEAGIYLGNHFQSATNYLQQMIPDSVVSATHAAIANFNI